MNNWLKRLGGALVIVLKELPTKKTLKRLAGAVVIALLVAQLIPVRHGNYLLEREFFDAPAEIRELMRRSCNDCHSNETRWPWFSYVAPVKFFVAHDVKEGREELNLSVWNRYDDELRARKKREIAKEVRRGSMPPWYYTPMNPEAKLTDEERLLIIKWANNS